MNRKTVEKLIDEMATNYNVYNDNNKEIVIYGTAFKISNMQDDKTWLGAIEIDKIADFNAVWFYDENNEIIGNFTIRNNTSDIIGATIQFNNIINKFAGVK